MYTLLPCPEMTTNIESIFTKQRHVGKVMAWLSLRSMHAGIVAALNTNVSSTELGVLYFREKDRAHHGPHHKRHQRGHIADKTERRGTGDGKDERQTCCNGVDFITYIRRNAWQGVLPVGVLQLKVYKRYFTLLSEQPRCCFGTSITK